MFHRVLSARRLLTGCTAGLLILVLAATASAQSLEDGWDPLSKAEGKHRTEIKNFFDGSVPMNPAAKADVDVVDLAAKVVTWRYVLDAGNEKKPGALDAIYQELDNRIRSLAKPKVKEASPDLGKVYSHYVMVHAVEVVNFPTAKPVARLNAARSLARLAELGQGELADALVEVLRKDLKQDQGRDGVRYWVLRGLHDLLALPPQMPPLFDESKVTLAILEFLDQPPFVSAGAPAEEIEGFRMLRREAVRALAQTHAPALPGVTDMAKQPAMWLARFAGNDKSLQPPPRLDERLEASLGLAHMRASKQVPNYQADYAAQQIGLFLEAFGKAANSEKEEKVAFKRQRPWKVDAARLKDALTAMREEVKDPHVAKVVEVGLRVLEAVKKREAAEAGDLSWFSNPDNAAPNQELFKGVANTKVEPAPAEAPAAPAAPAEK
jgi:hypothetical protein